MTGTVTITGMPEGDRPFLAMLRDFANERGSQVNAAKALGISKSRMSQLLAGDSKLLNPELLRAVARETNWDLRTVVDAALTTFGLPGAGLAERTVLEDVIAEDAGLSRTHKRLLLALLAEARLDASEARERAADELAARRERAGTKARATIDGEAAMEDRRPGEVQIPPPGTSEEPTT